MVGALTEMGANPKNLYYAKTDKPEEVQGAVKKLLELIAKFQKEHGVELGWEEAVLADVVRLYSRDIDKMVTLDKVKPNAYRQAAALCIWLARLKPVFDCVVKNTFTASRERQLLLKTQVNEMLALFAAITVLRADHAHAISRPGLDDLYSRAESISVI